MKHAVHIFVTVKVKVPDIEAQSHKEAIEKALDQTNLNELFDRRHPAPGIEHTEYVDECVEYLVDEAGDPEFEKSTFYKPEDLET